LYIYTHVYVYLHADVQTTNLFWIMWLWDRRLLLYKAYSGIQLLNWQIEFIYIWLPSRKTLHTCQRCWTMKLSLAYMCIYRYIYIQICLCVCNHVAKVSDNGCHIDKHISSGTTPLVIDWAEVFKTGWWMAHFGSISPKRHVGLSNNPWCDRFNIGKLHKAQRMACKGKTSVRKVDKATGKVTYQGTSQLKSTQNLAST
jgi:hypothetical protein